MTEKKKKRSLKGVRKATEAEIRKLFEDELVEKHGADYLKNNKELLEAQWEYIVELGLPDYVVTPDGEMILDED